MEKIQDTIARIPKPYRLRVEWKIDDLQGQTPEHIAESFRDVMEFMRYYKWSNSSKKFFLSAVLAIAGYFILGLMVVAQTLGWFGTDFLADLLEEMVDIAGWVFLWEAVTILFLESTERSISDLHIRKRIASLSILDSTGKVLVERSHDKLFQRLGYLDRLHALGRFGLLLSSCSFVMSGMDGFFYLLADETLVSEEILPYLPIVCTIVIISSLCQIAAGVGGFYLFFGRKNVFTKFSKGYAIAMLVVIALVLVLFCFAMEFTAIARILLSFSCTLVFIVSLFLDAVIMKKKQ